MTLLAYIFIASLVTYRVSRLLVVDDGPYRIFFRLRLWVGVYDVAANGEPRSELGRLFNCMYCAGFWLSFPISFIVMGGEVNKGAWWLFLAVAGFQSLMVDFFRLTNKD